MENGLLEFYRRHVQMSIYGTRCHIYNHFRIDPESEIGNEEVDLRAELSKLDAAMFDCIAKLDKLELPAEIMSTRDIDNARCQFEAIASEFHELVNKTMAAEPVRKKLFDLAMEEQRRQQIERNKAMVNPANLAGSPAGLNGATTATINKNGEVKPVEEKKDVPQNDKPIPPEENK